MEEDEVQTLDEIREEQIKEFFKSADPRNFIAKLKKNFHYTVEKERSIFSSELYENHPFIKEKSSNEKYEENESENKCKINIKLN